MNKNKHKNTQGEEAATNGLNNLHNHRAFSGRTKYSDRNGNRK